MKRMAQLGFAAWIVSAAPAWSQEIPTGGPVAAALSELPLITRDSPPPSIGVPVSEPRIAEPLELGDSPSGLMDATPEMIETSPAPIASGPSYDEVQRFHYGRCYVSETGSPTNSCCINSPCHSPDCPYCYIEPRGRLARIKAYMQRTHWGYCNYFDERPFGESMYSVLSNQIHRGLEESMMLYHYDFYPEGSQLAGRLTPRGRTQLMKIVERMQDHPSQIRIQVVESKQGLNQIRRQHVVETLTMIGADLPEQLVVLARVRQEGNAIEAGQVYENQLQSIISRGRTVVPDDSTVFGGN